MRKRLEPGKKEQASKIITFFKKIRNWFNSCDMKM